MAENIKNHELKDAETLRREREDREKEILDIASKMNTNMGFNSGSNFFGLKDTANGPAFVIRGQFDPSKLPDDWKYEANYLLDSDYGKEGIWRWKDGKREFIPIEREADKSQVSVYRSPDDVVNAILAENPHIDKNQIYFDNHSGAIELVGVVNNIQMPQGLKMEDGVIVDINDYKKKFEVRKSIANDVSKEALKAGSGETNTYGVQENLTRSAYQEEASLSKYNITDSQGAEFYDYGKSVFDFNELKKVYENYTKNARGEVVSREKDGSYRNMANMQEKDPMVEARYELAQVWIDAYSMASGSVGDGASAFAGEETAQKFDEMISIANSCRGLKVSQVVEILFDRGMESKVAIYFLSDPRMVKYFGYEADLSPAGAIEKLQELKDKRSERIADDMFGKLSALGSSVSTMEMDDDVPVMEMHKKGPGSY